MAGSAGAGNGGHGAGEGWVHGLHYTVHGQGQPVLLVHGWCCHGGFWQPVARRLGDGFHLVTLDLRGHGVSAAGDGYGVADFGGDVAAVVQALVPEGAVLVGHSLGAAAVLEAAAGLGGAVAGLVLVDPFVFDYGHLDGRRIRRLLAPFRRNLPRALSVMVENLTGPYTDERLARQLAESMARTSPDVALAAFDALLRWDPAGPFGRIGRRCPTLWSARGDPTALCRHARWLHPVIPCGSGHFPMLEAPDRFALQLRRAIVQARNAHDRRVGRSLPGRSI